MEKTLDRVLAVVRARADELRARGIVHVSVFGSVARREDGPTSDVGLVVDVARDVQTFDLMEIEELLASELGREVEIVTRRSLDLARHAEIFRDLVVAF